MSDLDPKRMMRRRDAAELVGVSERTIERWEKAGWLPRHSCGARSVRYVAAEVYAAAEAAAKAAREAK